MNDIYINLITDIKALLEDVDEVNAVYGYPISNVRKYPAVIFIPDSYDSDFETNSENMEIRRFKMWIIVNATQITLEKVFTSVLPRTFDAIRAEMAEKWDGGTIGGHRCWFKMDSGQWGISEGKGGLEAWCEAYLDIKLLTNN